MCKYSGIMTSVWEPSNEFTIYWSYCTLNLQLTTLWLVFDLLKPWFTAWALCVSRTILQSHSVHANCCRWQCYLNAVQLPESPIRCDSDAGEKKKKGSCTILLQMQSIWAMQNVWHKLHFTEIACDVHRITVRITWGVWNTQWEPRLIEMVPVQWAAAEFWSACGLHHLTKVNYLNRFLLNGYVGNLCGDQQLQLQIIVFRLLPLSEYNVLVGDSPIYLVCVDLSFSFSVQKKNICMAKP